MAEIKNRFVLFETRSSFEAKKANIASESIVFIADQQKIYTQGKFFTKDAFTQYQIDGKIYSPNDGWDPVAERELTDSIIKFSSGDGLKATAGANGEITYSLDSVSKTVNEKGTNTGKFIKNITVNSFGQVIGIEYANIVQNTYNFESAKSAKDGNAKLTFSMVDALDAENNKEVEVAIKGKASDLISVTSDADGNIEIAHDKAAAAVKVISSIADNQVSVLGNIEGDAWGHLISATQVSVPTKAYVDSEVEKLENLVGTSVDASLILQGVATKASDLEAKTTDDYTYTPKRGHTWKVGATFEFTNADGNTEKVKAGDVIVCVEDSPVAKWSAIQSNVDIATGSVLGLVKGGATNEASRTYGVEIDGNGSMTVKVPAQHIPEVTSKIVTAGDADAEDNAAVAVEKNKVYVNHLDKSDKDADAVISSHSFAGSGAVKVSANATGDITIAATDNDTTYTIAYSENASGSTVSIIPTKIVNGVAQDQGAPLSATVSSWGYPDKA